ncbi:MAG TPA: BON domain-containing protein [Steroidobacteraceae bacterium]|nr:BON domain-containing protein [Steroidobacteraceae bacterium]
MLQTVHHRGLHMIRKLLTTFLVVGALIGPIVAVSAGDSDTNRSQPKAFVKDSVITAKVKARLAGEHITSLGRIHVDTDKYGMVWLRGTAGTQAAADRAVEIARTTDGVRGVHSRIKVRKDD